MNNTDEMKQKAAEAESLLDTHNGTTKDDLINMVTFLAEKNEMLRNRERELEAALLDTIGQSSMDDHTFKHSFMSCDEHAYDVLDISYGESKTAVWKRFNRKWGVKE